MAKRDNSKTPPKGSRSGAGGARSVAADSYEAPADRSLALSISWYALLAMIAIVPVIISNFSWLQIIGITVNLPLTYDQFDIIKVFTMRVLMFVSLGAWAWHILSRGGRIRRTPVEWLVLAFLAWITVSALLSIHTPTALFGKYRRFEGLFSFVTYAVAYFLVLQHADRSSKIKLIAQVLFWSGGFVAFYGVLQSLGLDPNQWGALPFEARRAFSTYGNPDLLGGFLMFSMFISFGLALAEKRLSWRAIYWVGALLNVWCLIIAFTRSAWVGAFVGFIVLGIIAFTRKLKLERVDWGFVGVTSALATFVVVRSLSNPNQVMNVWTRLRSIFEFDAGSAKTRFQIWSAAIDAIKDRPIFGFGADTFRLIFPRYKPVEYVRDAGYLSVADNVHNYPLQLASGIGVPGVVLFYSIAVWVAVRTARMVFSPEGGLNRWVLVGFWTACASYVVHLFFGLSVTGVSLFFWISMAVLLSPGATVVEVKSFSWGKALGVVAVGLALAGVVFHFYYISADRAYLLARVSGGQDRVTQAERAVRLNPWNDIYRAEVGLAYMDQFTQNVNLAFQAQQTGGDVTSAIQAANQSFRRSEQSLKETIDFVPWEYDNYVFLASLYNTAGAYLDPVYYERAATTAKRGIEVERYGPAIRIQRARALMQLGDTEEAIQEAAYALEMDPTYAEAALLLSDLYEKTGDLDKALEVVKGVEAARPGQAGVADRIASLEASVSDEP